MAWITVVYFDNTENRGIAGGQIQYYLEMVSRNHFIVYFIVIHRNTWISSELTYEYESTVNL